MNLQEFVKANMATDSLWDGQYKIPWDEPGFSRRMLEHHLSQDHDLASRRLQEIDNQIEWIQRRVLDNQPSKVLDLGCGPGLYSHRLSARGHTCRGIDFSPASIEYAGDNNPNPDSCEFIQGDIRNADFGYDYDAVLMIYGEFNAFPRREVLSILRNAHSALRDGGRILTEAHTPEQIERTGREAGTWYKADSGLFSEHPHICLTENALHESSHVSETTFFVIDAESNEVTIFRNTLQGYTWEEYRELLNEAKFTDIEILPAWDKDKIEPTDALFLISARK